MGCRGLVQLGSAVHRAANTYALDGITRPPHPLQISVSCLVCNITQNSCLLNFCLFYMKVGSF